MISATGRTGDRFAAVGSALCGTPRTGLHKSKIERNSGVNMISLQDARRRADNRISVLVNVDFSTGRSLLVFYRREKGEERERQSTGEAERVKKEM